MRLNLVNPKNGKKRKSTKSEKGKIDRVKKAETGNRSWWSAEAGGERSTAYSGPKASGSWINALVAYTSELINQKPPKFGSRLKILWVDADKGAGHTRSIPAFCRF
jgi:hypothetical protein